MTLPERDQWVAAQTNELKQQLSKKLIQAWIDNYCHFPDSKLPEEETVFRCLHLKNVVVPTFAAQCFENNLGINAARADELIGLKENLVVN